MGVMGFWLLGGVRFEIYIFIYLSAGGGLRLCSYEWSVLWRG